jgi:hypothetical protein
MEHWRTGGHDQAAMALEAVRQGLHQSGRAIVLAGRLALDQALVEQGLDDTPSDRIGMPEAWEMSVIDMKPARLMA